MEQTQETPPAAETAAPQAPAHFWSRYRGEIVSVVLYCIQVLVVTAVIILFVGRVSIVQGGSMEPSIVTGERIIVNLLVYNFNTPHRGDVIVFRNPRDEAKDYIKRVIGLPGETVSIKEGQTFINGKKLAEPYVTHKDYGDHKALTLGAGQLFVMGDNRSNSEDSRRWGALPLRLVRGKASLVFWPPEKVTLLP